MRHDFESGASMEIRPIGDLKGKDRSRLTSVEYHGYDLDTDGDIDPVATTRRLGTAGRRDLYLANRRAAAVAVLVTEWSFGVPLPRIEGCELTGKDFGEELPIDDLTELEAILRPYTEKLTRTPDPKAPAAATTSSSNGRSKAKAVSLTG